MGSNQSNQGAARGTDQNTHGITIVNPNPGQVGDEERIVLPHRISPILSVEGHVIDPSRHGPEFRLDYQLWIDFVSIIDRFSDSRAELVATRQSQLQEKIQRVDEHVQRFTDSYINGNHKALARMNEDCRKVDEMRKLIEKCSIQSELCVDMLEKLNFLLPSDLKLEPFK